MQKSKGKIGKYKRMTQQVRSTAYLGLKRYMRILNRQYIEYGREEGYNMERGLVDKLKIKKGGKFRQEVWKKEAVSECAGICPNNHY